MYVCMYNIADESEEPLMNASATKQRAHLKECYLKSKHYSSTQETLEPFMNELNEPQVGRFDACANHYATNVLWQVC